MRWILTRAQRRQIQKSLAAQGFNPGPADGAFGRRTREAIRNWQTGQGEVATGYLTKLQVRALQEGNSESAVATTEKQAEDEGETVAKAPAVEDALGLTRLQRYQIQENLAAGGFNAGRADGVFGRLAREAIRNWQTGQGEVATGYLTEQQARALQEDVAKSAVASEPKTTVAATERQGGMKGRPLKKRLNI